jgi:hypothetical protein
VLKALVIRGLIVFKKKKSSYADCQWLMPEILTTQEAEIRRV